jgi:hypothetical protein
MNSGKKEEFEESKELQGVQGGVTIQDVAFS